MFLSLNIKQLKYFFLVVLLKFSEILVKKFSRVVGGLGCVGKKTALLQILDVCRLVRFANVLFCALAFIIFFLSLSSKLSAVSLSFYTCTQLTYMYHKMIQYIHIWLYMYHNGDILLRVLSSKMFYISIGKYKIFDLQIIKWAFYFL